MRLAGFITPKVASVRMSEGLDRWVDVDLGTHDFPVMVAGVGQTTDFDATSGQGVRDLPESIELAIRYPEDTACASSSEPCSH